MYESLSSEVLPQQIPSQSKVLVAVSGGPDSVALAHVIYRYSCENQDKNISFVITHVNHKVRREADKEAELVKNLAGEWKAGFILHEFDAKRNASACRQSFQEASREWRYARWKEDMEAWGCDLLATAHHLGDQAETVLYRLLRGSGTTGLAGIYPVKDKIIRPLLSVTKEEILEYCKVQSLPYSIDKSNLETDYYRNKIRLELIPGLESKYNQRITDALGRTAELLRWDEEYICAQTEALWPRYCLRADHTGVLLSHEAWKEPEAILSRLLRKAASQISGETRGPAFKFVKLWMQKGQQTGWRQDLQGFKVEVVKQGLFFFNVERESKEYISGKDRIEEFRLFVKLPLALNVWNKITELKVQVGIFDFYPEEQHVLWSTELDPVQMSVQTEPLVCRTRQAGDRIYFKNLGHKAIKKVFQDKDIPAGERDKILFFAFGDLVVWIPGVCRGDSLLPAGPQSSRLYLVAAEI